MFPFGPGSRPHPGDYHPEAFRQFDFFVRMAHRYGIYLHPTLFIGNEVGEAYWDVPWHNGRHPHADPALLRLQTEHAAEFARRFRGETAILAWDLTDEPPFWIVSDPKRLPNTTAPRCILRWLLGRMVSFPGAIPTPPRRLTIASLINALPARSSLD
ncbi:MAG: hypothetical protein ACOYYU_12420 [Chloroflexota bacterium]